MTLAALALLTVFAPTPQTPTLPALLTATVSSPVAPVQVTVNAKPNETITGERVFRVTVVAKNPVTGVEFYVGSDLRDKDTSTPYEFTLDSIAEEEGPLKLRFRAFTSEGEEGSVSVTVKIDNGTSKGLPFQLEAGQNALGEAKWDAAITAGRVALRIDPKSTDARLILARAYLGKSQFDKAQKFAEDAADADKNSVLAADLVTAIRLRQAFVSVNRPGTSKADSLKAISDAFKSAIESRRKATDIASDKVGTPNADNLVAYADAAIRGGRYSAIISALESAFRNDPRRTDIGNRLGYAQLRSGRVADAIVTLNSIRKFGQPTPFTLATLAIAFAETGDTENSDSVMKDAVLAGADDPAVLSAQAFISLKFVRRNMAGKFKFALNYDDATGKDFAAKQESRKNLQASLTTLLRDNSNRTEVLTLASALNNYLQEYGKGESYFQEAILADPLNADAYLEQGNRSLALAQPKEVKDEERTQRYDAARAYFEAAQAARPSATEPLTGLAIVYSFQKKYAEAISYGEAAVKAAPNYAAAQVALATAYQLNALASRETADAIRRKSNDAGTTNADRQANEIKARQLEQESIRGTAQARAATNAAAKLDARIQGVELTTAATAWRYFYAGGRTPIITAPR